MRILIISDTHFGFGKGTERRDDPFEYVSQALKEDADFILLGGDIFDAKVPDTETFVRAFRLFLGKHFEGNRIETITGIGKDIKKLPKLALKGVPIVGIHGTHERRIKGFLNPIQALEKMGILMHLHANGVVLEKGGERVCVQGLSGVPDSFAGTILDDWKPKPQKDCFNTFVFHQSVEGFVISDSLLPREKIPKGFDLYILGHIHTPQKVSHNGSPFIITGSAMPTQLKKEYISPMGYWIVDTKNPEPKFIEFQNQRRAYIVECGKEEAIKKIEEILAENHPKKPIIKIVSEESVQKEIGIKFGERALFYFQKKGKKAGERQAFSLEEHKLSVKELGRKLLLENLKKAGLDENVFEEVFELFSEKKPEEAVERLKVAGSERIGKGLDK